MYRVLYRKWRPQVFSDVVGQPQVTATLASQVRENRLAHAYLFTGSRGTGKTTCAKILSKAVNCLNPQNGNPCNACEICRGIDSGTVLDIVEIDAASNRGIDDIRLLRDEANFTPAQAKYRVYIIDEVHMLTIEAFNALLKTLEEPPAHVKFILATTEVHKLPSTILSRCQRFDFRRIEPGVIAKRLREIAEAEGTVLHEDAAMLIARIADGGMRDALSLLDRAISVSADVTTEVVSASAGLMGREHIYALLRAVADRDTASALTQLDALHNASCDTERLCVELTDQFRNFLMIKTVKHPENLIVCTADELSELRTLSDRFSTEEVLYALGVLTATADAIKRTQNRRIEAEIALIRLCAPGLDQDPGALTARVAALEREVARLKAGAPPAAPAQPAPEKPEPEPIPEPKPEPIPEPKPEPIPEPKPEPIPEPIPEPKPEPIPEPKPEPEPEPLPFDDAPPLPDEAPFDDAPPLPDEAPFDDAPPFPEDAPPLPEDAPPEEDLPFGEAPAAPPEVKTAPPAAPAFAGFARDRDAGTARKSAPPPDETDDEPFDFDAFMAEYGTVEKDGRREKAPSAPVTANSLDARTWVRIILDTERSFLPMIGLLTNSSAEIVGETLLIHPADPKVRFLLRDETLNRYLAPVAEKILGKRYQVRLDDVK